jgi:hypothetical protein
MPDPFITTADVVSYIGRGGPTDPAMVMAADAACDIVRDYTGQIFNRGTSTVALGWDWYRRDPAAAAPGAYRGDRAW